MTWRTSITSLRTRFTPRSVMIIGGTLAVLGGLTWLLLRADDSRSRAGTPPRASPEAAMPGMDMPGMPVPGMDMSPGGTVSLTEGQVREFGITFATVDVRPLEAEVRTVGVVTFDERRIARVSPKLAGFAERLYVNFTGQQVRRGQPLLELYSPELVAAQQELLVAQQLERTTSQTSVPGITTGPPQLVQAARQKLRLWDISDAQINEVLRTGRVRRTLTLFSPVSGTVVEKDVVEGQSVMPGQALYTVANLASVWVDAELRESDVGNVRVGSGADIELNAYPGRTFKGRVTYFYPTVEPTARTVKARIDVSNTGGLLRPGMYATVVIRTPVRSALTVPASAVINTGRRSFAFVDMGGGRLMPHDVVIGRTAGDLVEILSGLEPGQRVVTSAQFLLDSESNLGEVMRAMIGQMGSGDIGSMQDMPGMQMPGMDMKGADVPRDSRPRR